MSSNMALPVFGIRNILPLNLAYTIKNYDTLPTPIWPIGQIGVGHLQVRL
jgi:hypothetical protein